MTKERKSRSGGLARLARMQEQGGESDDPAQQDHSTNVKRAAIQQFMNENTPLLEAFVRCYGSDMTANADGLRELAAASLDLAKSAARQVSGKTEVSAAEVRPFRAPAAQFVARHWERGGKYDGEVVARQLAKAAELADPKYDRSVFQDSVISDTASMAMTAAAVSLRLMNATRLYSFRRNPDEVSAILVQTVLDRSLDCMQQMLPNGTSLENQRSLLQTLSGRFSQLMETIYEQQVRSTVASLMRMDEGAKVQVLQEKNPVEAVVRSFNEAAMQATALAVNYTEKSWESLEGPDHRLKQRSPEA